MPQPSTNKKDAHPHTLLGNTVGNANSPEGNFWAGTAALKQFTSTSANETMNAGALGAVGGDQPHTNLIPYLALNFIISLSGIFPSPN